MQSKDERAKRETENVAVSDQSSEDGGVDQEVCASVPSDDQIIHAIMDAFDLSFGEACDRILLTAENMRKAA